MNILDFPKMKKEGRKISMVTSYDHWSAAIAAQSEVDTLLVGDSLAMVVYGHPTTLNATVEMMVRHTEAVVRGAPKKFIVADMPFLSFRKGTAAAAECAGRLMAAGAHAVKLEGVRGHEDVVEHLVQSGIPVMGHLGLTPQSLYQFGGFKVQGRDDRAAEAILEDAVQLEKLGCFAVVLECVPEKLATKITQSLTIPTIGIGAGRETDGQVLVIQDLLGLSGFKPKFLKTFLDGEKQVLGALNSYHHEVVEHKFPQEEHCFR